MSSRQGEILMNTFLEAAGGEWRGVAMDDLLALLAAALEERAQAAASAGTASRTTSGGAQAAGSGSKAGSKVLSTALGMVPVAKALMAIFGGDDEKPPATLVKYALPPALRFEAANSRGGVASLDYGQEGLPRVAAGRAGGANSGAVELGLAEETGTTAFGDPAAQFGDRQRISLRKFEASPRIAETTYAGREAPNITIQVQAMDSRSFLDHSAEIAQAVREAMLNMHSLNDVVNDI
jgi:hypothetical protein